VNFSNKKILFRCDAGFKNELGSGHLFRSITIARYLIKRFKLKSNQIVFIIRVNKSYYNTHDILKKYKFKVIKITKNIIDYSAYEAKFLNQLNGELIVIDRLGKIGRKFVNFALANFKKKIIIDDSSANRKFFDLTFNPLITNVKNYKNSFIGLKYFISPLYFYRQQKNRLLNRGIFIYLGNLKNTNLVVKLLNIITQVTNQPIYLPFDYSKKFKLSKIKNKFYFFKNHEYYTFMQNSNLVIISGGMSLYDALFLKKKIICIPQFKHQKQNISKNKVSNKITFLDKKSKKFDKELGIEISYSINEKNLIKDNKIINMKNMDLTLKKIGNLLNDQR